SLGDRVLSYSPGHLVAGAIVIAAGVGSFQPRRIGIPGAEAFEGSHIHYRVKSAADYRNSSLVIFGGGDSALDWAIDFAPTARSLTLVHRRPDFRAAPASVAKMRELVAAGRMNFVEGLAEGVLQDGGQFRGVRVKGSDGTMHDLTAEHVFAFFGLHPKLGPIAEWGLALEKKALTVDTEKFQTSVPGIFAIGDINTYPGKKKLIVCGFHEATMAAYGAAAYLRPDRPVQVQYTTTSTRLHRLLGVAPDA
ncbi:MAG TPA: NAD(P)/FAD-dependent oxidoreductase, partial [Phycisphaerae bacterium]|nr:NAD(P)/FAD-dependent oxidoreductase [Phycisphaerae bacterium]